MVQLNEKLTQTQTSFENLLLIQKSKTVAVSPGPTDQKGVSVRDQALSQTKHDPDRGFVQDGSTKRYRTAKIFFEAGKWSDSILEFSQFLREYPDHLLAGSAQYHIGMSYLRQGENKLALDEFERVILAYERSAHITDTLRAMAEAQDKLHQSAAAQETRQQLISLFPLSPAARDLVYSKPATTPTAPLPASKEDH